MGERKEVWLRSCYHQAAALAAHMFERAGLRWLPPGVFLHKLVRLRKYVCVQEPSGSLASLQQTELCSVEATRSHAVVCGARVGRLNDTRGATVSRWHFNATTTQSITANRSRENRATSIAFRQQAVGEGV